MNPKIAEIQSLTGLRFILAMWVVLHHYRRILSDLSPGFESLDWITKNGGYAVPCFFILSGFIISYNYLNNFKKKDYLSFIWRRFARLWPVHFVVIVLFFAMFFLSEKIGVHVNSESFPLGKLLFEILMVRTWFQPELLMNKPAWSIQCEWFAYLIVFPLCALVFKLRWKNVALAALALVLLISYKRLSLSVSTLFAPMIVFPFMAGSALYILRKRLSRLSGSGIYSIVTLFAILIVLKYDLTKYEIPLMLVLCGAFVFFLSYSKGLIEGILSWKPIRFGGLISYSLYMTHHFFEVIWTPIYARLVPDGVVGKFLFASLLLIATLGLGSIFYLLIEKPANRFLVKSNPFHNKIFKDVR
jgi:peptidoglycan/LPS O-acetylase OafA/YrhL